MEGKSPRRCSGTELSGNLLNFYSEHSLRETESLASSDDDVFLNADEDYDRDLYPIQREEGSKQGPDTGYIRLQEWQEKTPTNVYRHRKYHSTYTPYKKPRSLDGLPVYTHPGLSPSKDLYQNIRSAYRYPTSFDKAIIQRDSQTRLSTESSSINHVRKRLRFDLPNGVFESTNKSSNINHFRPQRSKSESDYTEYENQLTEQQQDVLIQNLMEQLRKRKHTLSNKYRRCHEFERDTAQESVQKVSSADWRNLTHFDQQIVTPGKCKDRNLCPCSMMEKQLMEMAGNAYKNIRRLDGSPTGFQQFLKELTETNVILKESLELLTEMKEYCQRTCGCR